MAINPTSEFPGKIDNTDLANYPYGKARNITTPNDGTGTPWVANLLNDLFGFQQAMLNQVGVAPSGTPETIVASQYLSALITLMESRFNQRLSPSAVQNVAIGSGNSREYKRLTYNSGGNITVTLNAPTPDAEGNFGQTVTFDKQGANVDFIPGGGVSPIDVAAGTTLDLTVTGQVATCIALDATTWKFIK